MEKISVIIPTIKERKRLLDRLLASIPKGYEIIVVDDENLSLAAKRNKGAAKATGISLLFVDDDNYLHPDAIKSLDFYRYIPVLGLMACYDSDPTKIADGGSKRHLLSGFARGLNTNKDVAKIPEGNYAVDEVANAFMIRKDAFVKFGGFDEIRFPMDLDEADFCRRVKKEGWRVAMCPGAICYHKSITYSRIPNFRRPLNAYMMGRNRIFFQAKHLSYPQFLIYMIVFFPIFVLSYCLCLFYRRKPRMLCHFLKGVKDGLLGNFEGAKKYWVQR